MSPKDKQDIFLLFFIFFALYLLRREHFASRKKTERRVIETDREDQDNGIDLDSTEKF
jgi:hypothetical protein